MDKKGLTTCTPILSDENIETEVSVTLASGYVLRALDQLPKQGNDYLWKLNQNYIKDRKMLLKKDIDDGYLIFKLKPS